MKSTTYMFVQNQTLQETMNIMKEKYDFAPR